jgi:hypothetical protein
LVLGSSGDFNVTRATTATRVNANGFIESVASGVPRLDYYTSGGTAGCPALLVEPSAQNAVLRSEEFDDATWTKSNTTISGNTDIGPNGTLTADTINLVSGTSSYNANQNASFVSGTVYTISSYYKQNALRYIQLTFTVGAMTNGGYANFDLQTGSVTSVSGGTATITPAANGYYRCTFTNTANVTITAAQVAFFAIDSSGSLRAPSFLNAGIAAYFAWGAQLEVGSVATSYIPTTAAPVTRNADVITLSGAVSGCIGQTEGTMYWEGAINRFDREFFTLASGSSTTQLVRLQTTGAGLIQGVVVAAGTPQCIVATFAAITLGQFVKVAFAYKQNDFVLYLNGVKQNTDDLGTLPTNLNSVYLLNSNGTTITDQRCRAAALYTTRLTDSELAALTT